MGLILAPDEIKTNMQVLRSYLNSMTECYQNVLGRVYEYNDEEALDTESFRESKNQMSICYRLIAEGMISVQESITGDIDTLLGCIGDEYLDEDELKAQIEKLQAQCEQYEQKIAALRSVKSMFLGIAGVAGAHGMILYYQKMIENLKEEIAVLQEKLFFLHEAEDLTVNLFQLAMGSLRTVQNVIRDAGVNVREGNFPKKLVWLDPLQNADDIIADVDSDMEGILVIPEPGDTITVSRGVDLEDEYVDAVVSQWNAWSREYSIVGCNTNPRFSGQLCCRRLNYAVANYTCNKDDDDLLMFDLKGYDEPVFAGAMVEGYADIGDIVRVTLDDGNNFNFLILDVKYTGHTSEELGDKRCQCEWGHGYLSGENTVQLCVCEFITAGDCSVESAIHAKSGGFLLKRRVVSAQIVDSIPIED